jgi:hypothetical protein
MLRPNFLAFRLVAIAWFIVGLVLAPTSHAQKPASPDFVAVPIDGEPFSGRLVKIESPWRFSLLNSERKTIGGLDLVSLARKDQPQISGVSGSQVLLANGDRIRATAHHATQELLRANSELLGDLEIPLERVQAIVLNAPPERAVRDKLLAGLMSSQRKADVIVLANGDELKGTFLGLDDNSIRLDGSQGVVEINRNGVRAVALSSDLISFPPPKELYAKVLLADGSELALLDGRLDGSNFRGRAAFEREITLPLEQLVAVEFRNGRLTYLSDLDHSEYRHTPYLGVRYPYQRDRSVTGNVLSLRGQVFRKGLGMHSRSELAYRLDGQYRRFEAVVGIDDETSGQGSVIFRVLLDGQPAWESQPVTGQVAAQRVQLDVAGARRIALVVDFGALGDVQDHADWAEARLIR